MNRPREGPVTVRFTDRVAERRLKFTSIRTVGRAAGDTAGDRLVRLAGAIGSRLACGCGILATGWALAAEPTDRYLWEAHTPGDLAPTAGPLVVELRRQVDAILEAGHLAPLRFSGSDQAAEGFYLYTEPGRILATLGSAYPYLTVAEQAATRAYVGKELGDPRFSPTSDLDTLPPAVGTRREFYPMSQLWQWTWARQFETHRPRLAPLYGLWLCSYRSGDWSGVSNHWPALRDFYRRRAAGPLDCYGSLGAHLAMARMAFRLHDDELLAEATRRGRAAFADGLDFAAMTERMRRAYPRHFDRLQGRGLAAGNWFFLDLSPEVGRFLLDHLREPVRIRHRALVEAFPHWWGYRPWYASGWTGHESQGLPPEILGMAYPIERWVEQRSAADLAAWQPQFAAHGIGDCHALEALALTLGAFGADRWFDVRTQPEPPGITLSGMPVPVWSPAPAGSPPASSAPLRPPHTGPHTPATDPG